MAYIPLEALRFVPSKRASLGDDVITIVPPISRERRVTDSFLVQA